MIDFPLPLLGFSAYSGTGKTTLLCKLIPLLKAKGIRIGVIKHSHHDIEIDQPRKDSYKLRQSGAAKIVIASKKRTAVIIEHPDIQDEPSLEYSLKSIQTDGLDLVFIEGCKFAGIPKIELNRKALNKPYLFPNDENIIAIAFDHKLEDYGGNLPSLLDLNHPQQIADFIEENIIKTVKQ